jgi:uncharacterized membrane protein
MLLEVTVLRFVLFFAWRFQGGVYVLTVFWMLGLSMVVLAVLVHLPTRVLAPLSLAVIATHNLLDRLTPERFGRAAVWDILHPQALFPLDGASVVVAYPLIPWFAVMAAGYCWGPVLLWEPPRGARDFSCGLASCSASRSSCSAP